MTEYHPLDVRHKAQAQTGKSRFNFSKSPTPGFDNAILDAPAFDTPPTTAGKRATLTQPWVDAKQDSRFSDNFESRMSNTVAPSQQSNPFTVDLVINTAKRFYTYFGWRGLLALFFVLQYLAF